MPVQYAGEYKLLECNIMLSTGSVARLDDKVISFQIYEIIFSQSLVASLTIVDNLNLTMSLPIVGQEFVSLRIETPDIGEINFTDSVFAVTSVKVRQDVSNDTQIYDLTNHVLNTELIEACIEKMTQCTFVGKLASVLMSKLKVLINEKSIK